jgi:hypothetical protein
MSFPVAAAALDDFAGAMEVRCTRILTSEGGIGVTYLFDDRVNHNTGTVTRFGRNSKARQFFSLHSTVNTKC